MVGIGKPLAGSQQEIYPMCGRFRGSRTSLGLEEEFELIVSLWVAAVLGVKPICALASLYQVAKLPWILKN